MNDALIAKFVDDPGSLSPGELVEIEARLRADPDLRRDVNELLQVGDTVDRTLSADRRGFVTQVRERVRDLELGAARTRDRRERLMARIRESESQDSNRWVGTSWDRWRKRILPAVLASAAVVVAALGLWLVRQGARGEGGGQESVVAKVGTVTGAVSGRGADGTTRVLGAGAEIGPRDRVLTGTNGEVELTWKDGTRITARENSEFGFADCRMPDGRYRKALDLTRGGISMSVAKQPAGSPATITTPNGRCTAIGTKFFLMVAEGTTANRTPWSFTRLDVTEGLVQFRQSATGNGEPATIQVPAGRAVCAGRDADGRGIATDAFESQGREMSPEYGGVFYRDCAKFYAERRAWLLEAGGARKGAVLRTISAAECARIGKASAGLLVRPEPVERNGRKTEVLRLTARGDGKNEEVFTIPLPSAARDGFFMEWEVAGLSGDVTWGVGGSKVPGDGPFVPQPGLRPPVPKTDGRNRVLGQSDRWEPWRIEMWQVGSAPDGAPLWEMRGIYRGKSLSEGWLRFHSPGVLEIGVPGVNAAVRVGPVKIGALSLAADDAGRR